MIITAEATWLARIACTTPWNSAIEASRAGPFNPRRAPMVAMSQVRAGSSRAARTERCHVQRPGRPADVVQRLQPGRSGPDQPGAAEHVAARFAERDEDRGVVVRAVLLLQLVAAVAVGAQEDLGLAVPGGLFQLGAGVEPQAEQCRAVHAVLLPTDPGSPLSVTGSILTQHPAQKQRNELCLDVQQPAVPDCEPQRPQAQQRESGTQWAMTVETTRRRAASTRPAQTDVQDLRGVAGRNRHRDGRAHPGAGQHVQAGQPAAWHRRAAGPPARAGQPANGARSRFRRRVRTRPATRSRWPTPPTSTRWSAARRRPPCPAAALLAARQQAAAMPAANVGVSELTTQPLDAEPAGYNDPVWSNAGAGFRDWSPAGPPRSRSDGSTYYAGTADGGVWKSTDRGQHWHPIWDDAAHPVDRRAAGDPGPLALGGHR